MLNAGIQDSVVDSALAFFGSGVFNETVCISLKNEYVYFAVPKAANTSIKSALHSIEFDGLQKHPQIPTHAPFVSSPFVKPYQLGQKQLEDILTGDEFFKFTFVRNPYTRTLSSFIDKVLNATDDARKYYRNAANLPLDSEPTFTEFVAQIAEHEPRRMDKHWRPQSYQSLSEFIPLDFVGKVENLERDFAQVMNRIGVESELQSVAPHQTNALENFQKHCDAETAQSVSRLFRRDFEVFGYDPTPPTADFSPRS